MSNAFKKCLTRKIHKERDQPKSRKRLGLLEKKKDYKLRAKDYHRKEDKLTELRRKAAMKNPDEFYFKMASSSTQNGVHMVGKGKQYTHEQRKKMKTQDLGYFHMKKQMEKQKINRMKADLHFLSNSSGDSETNNKHVIFCDSQEKMETFSAAEHFGTAPELVSRKYNRPRMKDLSKHQLIKSGGISKRDMIKIEKKKLKQYKELEARMERTKGMNVLINRLQTHKNLMGKGVRRKVTVEDKFGDEDKDKTYYKWKLERRKG